MSGIAFWIHVATTTYGKIMKVRGLIPGQNEEDASFPQERSLEEIISPALSELCVHSGEVCTYLISLAKNRFFEKHQTKGSITELAEKLLRMLEGE